MAHPPGTQPVPRRTPLSAEEKVRAEANFVPLVAEQLAAGGRFRVSADTPELVELFQGSPAGWVTCSSALWSATPTAGTS
ncbi:hypothetical protein ACWDLG_26330 [Nonomuraea sp. NPDC003727]